MPTPTPDFWDIPDYDELSSNPADWEPIESRRCDACWMKMEYLVEIPRSRTTRAAVEPGRLRLCRLHAQNVRNVDPYAVIRRMKPEERTA